MCEKCDTVDSLTVAPMSGGQFLCTCCQGHQWHGYFEKRQYDPYTDKHMLNKVDEPVNEFGEYSLG